MIEIGIISSIELAVTFAVILFMLSYYFYRAVVDCQMPLEPECEKRHFDRCFTKQQILRRKVFFAMMFLATFISLVFSIHYVDTLLTLSLFIPLFISGIGLSFGNYVEVNDENKKHCGNGKSISTFQMAKLVFQKAKQTRKTKYVIKDLVETLITYFFVAIGIWGLYYIIMIAVISGNASVFFGNPLIFLGLGIALIIATVISVIVAGVFTHEFIYKWWDLSSYIWEWPNELM